MGTRNLTCVVKDGEFKVAQYSQWDGYPAGQGATVCKFIVKNLKKQKGLEKFSKLVDKLIVLTEEETNRLTDEATGSKDGWLSLEQSKALAKKLPALHRDTGAKILQYIMDSDEGVGINLATEFAGDGLFCKWCYVLDLDNEILEVYNGFHKKALPGGERFAKFSNTNSANEYAPVQLFEKIPFSDVNSKTAEKLQEKYDAERE